MPFRQAHEVSGRAVKAADEAGVQLWEVDLPAVDPALTPRAVEALSVDAALAAIALEYPRNRDSGLGLLESLRHAGAEGILDADGQRRTRSQ